MEDNANYQVVAVVSPPDMLDSLNLGELSRKKIIELGQVTVINGDENGEDVLRYVARAAKMELFSKTIKDAAKTVGLSELLKFDKGGVTKEGVVLTIGQTTSYDYSTDPIWQRLSEDVENAKKALSAHQEFLKRLPTQGMVLVDGATGQEYRAYPALKIQDDIIKATIK